MIDARDKLAGLIRHAIEDEAGLELVTSPGKPTPRGGYDTTWMYAENGTATSMTIEASWYSDSASFTLAGPAVEQADEAFFAARRLHRGQKNVNHGPLQCRIFVPYADGDRVDLLRAVLPALLAPYHAEPTADFSGLDVVVAAPDGTEQLYRVSGDQTLTVLVEGQPVLGVDRHGPGRWIGDEWRRLYTADRIVDRSVAIEGITTEAQSHEFELDGRHLSKEATEESTKVSNDRYRPGLHGRTFIAVRAEPTPGTNKFRNLDHPSLTKKATAPGGATKAPRPAARRTTASAVAPARRAQPGGPR